MIGRRTFLALGSLFATFWVAGCASRTVARGQKDSQALTWSGRLSVRVAADPAQTQPQEQSFSAEFELQGTPEQGELQFFTPLGSTAATIRWLPGNALLQARGETREFTDLAQLIRLVLGTDVPVTALFGWLAGRPQAVDGWQVDLTNRAQGKISARRTAPAPVAELRVLLDD